MEWGGRGVKGGGEGLGRLARLDQGQCSCGAKTRVRRNLEEVGYGGEAAWGGGQAGLVPQA